MKKIFYGLTLILSIGMCLSLLFFPILKFDRDVIRENHKEDIQKYIEENADGIKTNEELEKSAINDIIRTICISLQIHGQNSDVVFDENGNLIESGNDYEAIIFDIERIKDNGIKYVDLANSIKNQIEYDIDLYKAIKSANSKVDMKLFFDNWSNPLPMILLVILIAFEFACGVILIVRSVKGINERKRNKVLLTSILGFVVSIGILLMPVIFKHDINIANVTSINDYVGIFAMNVKGASVCFGCLICFGISSILALVAKFLRYN